MKQYWEVLKTRGVARLIFSQLVARFPAGMLSLAILMFIEQTYGNYTAAGAVLASLCVAQAVASPVSSRLMSRFGMRPVLIVTTILSGIALLVLALAPMPLWAAAVLAALTGLTVPPVPAAVRTIYPKVVTAERLSPLYALDASLQEIIWVLGPVFVTTTALFFSPAAAIVVAGGILLLGGTWFISSPDVGRVRIPPSKQRLGGVLANPVVLVTTMIGAVMVASFAALEAAVVSTFGHERPDTGIVLGVSALGSLIGGLTFGHLLVRPWSLGVRLTIVASGTALTIVSQETWWLCIMLFVAGAGIAPVFSGSNSAVSSAVRFSDTAEAFGWLNMGQLAGAALGSAIAGIAIDSLGSIGGYLAATCLAALSMLIAYSSVRVLPDLKGRTARPRTDTIPVQTVS